MNDMKLLSLATALALAAPSLPAADTKEVAWNQVCRETTGHELELTTATGETVSGYCVGVSVNEIGIRTGDAKVVKIAWGAAALPFCAIGDLHTKLAGKQTITPI